VVQEDGPGRFPPKTKGPVDVCDEVDELHGVSSKEWVTHFRAIGESVAVSWASCL